MSPWSDSNTYQAPKETVREDVLRFILHEPIIGDFVNPKNYLKRLDLDIHATMQSVRPGIKGRSIGDHLSCVQPKRSPSKAVL